MNMVCGCGQHARGIENGKIRVYERSVNEVCERVRPLVREKRDLVKRTGELILEMTSFYDRAADILIENFGDDERFKRIWASWKNKTDLDNEYILHKLGDEDVKRIAIIGKIGMTKEAEIKRNNILLKEIEGTLGKICFEESVLQSLKCKKEKKHLI